MGKKSIREQAVEHLTKETKKLEKKKRKLQKKLDKPFQLGPGYLIIKPLLPPEREAWAILLDHAGQEMCALNLTKKGNLKPPTEDFFQLPIGFGEEGK